MCSPLLINHDADPRMSTERDFRIHQPEGSRPLKRDRADVLRMESSLNPEPNLACPARTPFLGEAVEGHPNRLDAEVALKIVFGVASDRSGLRTFRARLFQALEHNVAKGALWRAMKRAEPSAPTK